MQTHDMTERLLRSATAVGKAAEVFSVESESRTVQFEANQAKNVSTRQSSGHALRLISQGGRVGFASTTDGSRVDELTDRASASSEYGAEALFEMPGQASYPMVESVDARVSDITADEMLEVGGEIVARVLGEFPDALCDVHVTTVRHEQRLVNSTGANIESLGTQHGISFGAEIISGTDMLSVWDGISSGSRLLDDDVDVAVERMLASLRNSQRIVPAPVGDDIPVVFTPPGFAGSLLPPLLSGVSGTNVATGSSPLIDRWGEKAFDERVTLYDDPLRPLTSGTRRADDEGVAARRVSLIADGVIGSPILDLQTAAKCDMEPNGCGLRGLGTTPSPSTSFVRMAAGDTDTESMVGDVERGIVVQQLLGAGQGNQLGGELRANLSLGFLIESGEIAGRVKDTMISGNVYDVLNRVDAISSDARVVWGSRELPMLRCTGVEVAAAKG